MTPGRRRGRDNARVRGGQLSLRAKPTILGLLYLAPTALVSTLAASATGIIVNRTPAWGRTHSTAQTASEGLVASTRAPPETLKKVTEKSRPMVPLTTPHIVVVGGGRYEQGCGTRREQGAEIRHPITCVRLINNSSNSGQYQCQQSCNDAL